MIHYYIKIILKLWKQYNQIVVLTVIFQENIHRHYHMKLLYCWIYRHESASYHTQITFCNWFDLYHSQSIHTSETNFFNFFFINNCKSTDTRISEAKNLGEKREGSSEQWRSFGTTRTSENNMGTERRNERKVPECRWNKTSQIQEEFTVIASRNIS